MGYRIEHDSMGEVRVPFNKFWGAQTQRSVENFPIGAGIETMPSEVIRSFGLLKKAAALANRELRPGQMTREKAEDRRGNLLRITDAGRDAIPGIQAAPEDDPFAPLSPEQQDQLSDMLRALLTRWIDTLEPCPRGQNKPVQV